MLEAPGLLAIATTAWIYVRLERAPDAPDRGHAILGLGVVLRERVPALELVGERQDPGVPERDVAEHTGDGPVLVHGEHELVVVQPLDESAEPFALPGVLRDEVAVARHHREDIGPNACLTAIGPP